MWCGCIPQPVCKYHQEHIEPRSGEGACNSACYVRIKQNSKMADVFKFSIFHVRRTYDVAEVHHIIWQVDSSYILITYSFGFELQDWLCRLFDGSAVVSGAAVRERRECMSTLGAPASIDTYVQKQDVKHLLAATCAALRSSSSSSITARLNSKYRSLDLHIYAGSMLHE